MIELFRKVSGSYYKSNYLSFQIRKIIQKINIRKTISINLGLFLLVSTYIIPKLNLVYSSVATNYLIADNTTLQNTNTQVTFLWPLQNFQVSQTFHFYHPGIDLTSTNDSITATGKGVVESVSYSIWGYGNNIVIKHENGYYSLYAHLSETLVKTGNQVNQETVIGKIGDTGWATGPHLHLEIYGPEGKINPQDVLPKV